MGTSGAFGGSGGKDAKDLRDNIADWLTDAPAPAPAGDGDAASDDGAGALGVPGLPGLPTPNIDLLPTIRILTGRGGGSDGPGGGGGGASGGAGGGRSSGGARRSVGATSRAAGRAGALARAYASGDRVSLERAGLNYDDLLSLGDMGLFTVECGS